MDQEKLRALRSRNEPIRDFFLRNFTNTKQCTFRDLNEIKSFAFFYYYFFFLFIQTSLMEILCFCECQGYFCPIFIHCAARYYVNELLNDVGARRITDLLRLD